LFTGFTIFESLLLPSQSQEHRKNLYHVEDEIFNLVNNGKVREFPFDMFTLPITVFNLSSLSLSDWLLDTPGTPGTSDLVFGGLCFLAVFILQPSLNGVNGTALTYIETPFDYF
jgi:hypothetical protein